MPSFNVIFDISYFGLIFFTSLLLSLLLIPVSSKIAAWFKVMDHPDERKVHDHPLPKSGGIAIALSCFLAIVMSVKLQPIVQAYLSGGCIAAFMGFLDDKFHVPPKLKFLGEIVAAVVFIAVGKTYLTGLGNILGFGNIHFAPAGPFVTVFCMVGVMNALNLSDGLDGLAAGISVISLFFLAILAYEIQSWYVLSVIIALFGSVIGFLRFNNHPAKVFMGDTGSLLLGFVLGAVAVDLATGGGLGKDTVAPATLAIVLSVPIVDTLLVMGKRILKGLNPFYPDKTHLHHRFLNLGLEHSQVVAIIYSWTILFCLLGWSTRSWPDWLQFYLAILGFVALYLLLGKMEKKGYSESISKLTRKISDIKRTDFVPISGKSVKFIQPFFLFLFLIPAILILPVQNAWGLLSFSMVCIIVILYPWKSGKKSMPIAYGILFIACFYLLILYHFNSQIRPSMFFYLNTLSVLAFAWVAFRLLFHRYDRILFPSGFELLLIGFSWFILLVLGSILDISTSAQRKLFWACLEAIPLLGVVKLTMRSHARRNKGMALSFVLVFVILGTSAYLI